MFKNVYLDLVQSGRTRPVNLGVLFGQEIQIPSPGISEAFQDILLYALIDIFGHFWILLDICRHFLAFLDIIWTVLLTISPGPTKKLRNIWMVPKVTHRLIPHLLNSLVLGWRPLLTSIRCHRQRLISLHLNFFIHSIEQILPTATATPASNRMLISRRPEDIKGLYRWRPCMPMVRGCCSLHRCQRRFQWGARWFSDVKFSFFLFNFATATSVSTTIACIEIWVN